MKELAKILHKPSFPLEVPFFVLKIIFGEMATILLEGSRDSSEKILNSGFEFEINDFFRCIKIKRNEKCFYTDIVISSFYESNVRTFR